MPVPPLEASLPAQQAAIFRSIEQSVPAHRLHAIRAWAAAMARGARPVLVEPAGADYVSSAVHLLFPRKIMNLHDDATTWATRQFAVGQPVPRSEDPTLVRGEGRYTDDVNLPGQAHAAMVRS